MLRLLLNNWIQKIKCKKLISIFVISCSLISIAIILTIYYYPKMFGHHMFLIKTSYDDLPGWKDDDQRLALETLEKSCVVVAKRDPNKPLSKHIAKAGKFANLQQACLALKEINKDNPSSARTFFEKWFIPYHIYNNLDPKGLFTGYYLPKLNCSLYYDKKHYKIPIRALPADWVKVDLGIISSNLRGRTFVGQVKNRRLRKYPTSESIRQGNIAKNAKIIVWCNDKIDKAFAQIQGSALIELPSGKQFLIGYEGSNGRSYTGLGKILINKKELSPNKCSMQDIRSWLLNHPDKADDILNKNLSYVFFRTLNISDPLGSQQVPLTPERSLAVDLKHLPLGLPIWINTTYNEEGKSIATPFQRLMITQDTGGAIKGIVRGDIYWGAGEQASYIAGHLKSQGEYWVLLPRQEW